MKMEEAELDDIGKYASDPGWIAEQKVDGVRMMVRIGDRRMDIVGFGGVHLAHSASVLHFPAIREAFAGLVDAGVAAVFDGELLPGSGEFWLYDLPLLVMLNAQAPTVEPVTPFVQRRAMLEAVVAAGVFDGTPVKLLPQATTEQAKLLLYERVYRAGGEGLVVKRVDAAFQSGRRVRTQLKLKFVKTADVVITARDVDGHTNAHLGVYQDGKLVPVGACSMIGKPNAQVGDVVEVRYLYWTGASVYQPRLVRVRTDKAPAECTDGQFTVVSKEVLAA